MKPTEAAEWVAVIRAWAENQVRTATAEIDASNEA
jgi:hypothetical protein